jgi:hypothetical protein
MGRSSAGGGYVYGVRSVAFILISQFCAFRHVITKRLELKKNTALTWLSMPPFIPSFFFEPLNLIGSLKDSLKRTWLSHMRVFFFSEELRCRHVIRT